MDLSGNPIENLPLAVESLQTMPALSSLYINLHEEEQVDYLLRSMPTLTELNGLEVERDAIFSPDEETKKAEDTTVDLGYHDTI